MAVATLDAGMGKAGATAAVVGADDSVTQRVAGVLNQHEYRVVFHPSPEDLLAGLDVDGALASADRNQSARAAAATEQDYDRTTAQPALYILNCRPAGAQENCYPDWLHTLRILNGQTPRTPILITVDDEQPGGLIRGAIEAGADEILRAGETEIEELVWTRVQSALARAEAAPPAAVPNASSAPGIERRVRRRRLEDRLEDRLGDGPALGISTAMEAPAADVTETWEERATENEVRAARERVNAMLDRLPGVEERRAPLADLLGVTAPTLRADSGRLDARKIATELGVSLSSLAKITPISRQALNETPDSPRAQAALDPLARTLDVLGTVLSREHMTAWLNTPHRRLTGETPIQAILQGRGEQVARMLEMVRDGGVD